MDCYLQKNIYMNDKITFFTNGYMPDREGGSKELASLYSYFRKNFRNKVYLCNIADRWKFSLKRRLISYPDRLLLFGYIFLKYHEKTSKLIHIYGSLTGRIYSKLLKRRPCIHYKCICTCDVTTRKWYFCS